MSELIAIDGSEGEGGGQIIRSALALSMVTGRPFEIFNIRANRSKPGLLRQHLTAVNAARELCGGAVTGAELGSRQLIFAPGPIQYRDFQFSIGSAGSTTLVAQTLIPALMIGSQNSSIEIEGGTHNSAAPPYDYLDQVYLPILHQMGPKFHSAIHAWGFYPAGGGKIKIEIQPTAELRGLSLIESEGTPVGTVTAVVSRLPISIAERETETIRRKAGWQRKQCQERLIETSPGPGNVVMIRWQWSNLAEIFTGFGRLGRSAEQVALDAWKEAKAYLVNQVPVGEYLCDQLLLPLGLAAMQGNESQFRTGPLSQHAETHIELLQKFLEIEISVLHPSDRQKIVTVGPGRGQEPVSH